MVCECGWSGQVNQHRTRVCPVCRLRGLAGAMREAYTALDAVTREAELIADEFETVNPAFAEAINNLREIRALTVTIRLDVDHTIERGLQGCARTQPCAPVTPVGDTHSTRVGDSVRDAINLMMRGFHDEAIEMLQRIAAKEHE